eukprot:30850-Pelagococcus_subviridis.AAC.10
MVRSDEMRRDRNRGADVEVRGALEVERIRRGALRRGGVVARAGGRLRERGRDRALRRRGSGALLATVRRRRVRRDGAVVLRRARDRVSLRAPRREHGAHLRRLLPPLVHLGEEHHRARRGGGSAARSSRAVVAAPRALATTRRETI